MGNSTIAGDHIAIVSNAFPLTEGAMVADADILSVHKFLGHVIGRGLRGLEDPHSPRGVNDHAVGVHNADPPLDPFETWRTRVLPHGLDYLPVGRNVRHIRHRASLSPTRHHGCLLRWHVRHEHGLNGIEDGVNSAPERRIAQLGDIFVAEFLHLGRTGSE